MGCSHQTLGCIHGTKRGHNSLHCKSKWGLLKFCSCNCHSNTAAMPPARLVALEAWWSRGPAVTTAAIADGSHATAPGHAGTAEALLSAAATCQQYSLHVSCYDTPFSEPPRLKVSIVKSTTAQQPGVAAAQRPPASRLEISINLPLMTTPPAWHFFFNPDAELGAPGGAPARQPAGCNSDAGRKGLLQQLLDQGVVKLTDTPPAPLPGRADKAPLLQLCWPPEDCEVHIPSVDERRRAAEDHERFMSNTYIMHLGM